MHYVSEGVAAVNRSFKVVVQVVDVHVAVAEAAARCNVKIAHNFIYAKISFDAAAFLALGI